MLTWSISSPWPERPSWSKWWNHHVHVPRSVCRVYACESDRSLAIMAGNAKHWPTQHPHAAADMSPASSPIWLATAMMPLRNITLLPYLWCLNHTIPMPFSSNQLANLGNHPSFPFFIIFLNKYLSRAKQLIKKEHT
jgi:hypothetical protein